MRGSAKLFLIIFASLSGTHAAYYTPLEIDNHPCQPENLKRAQSYTCSRTGEIVCQNGWKEPDESNNRDPMNPCPQPICHRCVHGSCVGPNTCACEVGWEGMYCDTCIPLPGCKHGYCEQALECRCNIGYGGGFCDVPECGVCTHGFCADPNMCVCFDGWTGENCTECVPLNGCVNGQCIDHPHTCTCENEWEGPLCNVPVCNPPCEHGICITGQDGNHLCKCETGWEYKACNQCVPYWDCPNQGADACSLPNECHCSNDTVDPQGLCSPLTDKTEMAETGSNISISPKGPSPFLISNQVPKIYPKTYSTSTVTSKSSTEEVALRNNPEETSSKKPWLNYGK